ncbi:MAG: biopolymer transporter ExbD [Pseudobdellovibrionaceae bacterium]
MSRRKRFELKGNHNSTFALNVTSMTDMFTIMLVFLLQTYTTSEVQVIPDKDQALPTSNSEANPVMALQISVTRTQLKIEDRVIASLQSDDFTRGDIDPNDTNFIKPLFAALEKAAKEEKERDAKYQANLAAGTPEMIKDAHGNLIPAGKPNPGILDGKIIVKADQNLSYGVLRKVMYTASMAGFPKMKMATVVGN